MFFRTTYLVHPKLHGITEFFPQNPPQKGDIVLIEGFVGLNRCRVVSNPEYSWRGLTWTLHGAIRVRPAESA